MLGQKVQYFHSNFTCNYKAKLYNTSPDKSDFTV